MDFISSDLHFYHKKILTFQSDSRPFESVDEMNEQIIDRANSMVKPDDVLYIVGDVTFGSVGKTCDLLRRLNGSLILITGNHDEHALRKESFRSCFAAIHPYLEIKVDGKLVVLFHYDINNWKNKHHGSYHLHGHLHSINKLPLVERKWDVGLDSNNCYPYDLGALISNIEQNMLKNEEILDHHGRILRVEK